MDKSGANNAAIDEINTGREILIVIHQVEYLNHIVEQDHRVIKRVTKPMPDVKSFRSARNVLSGIELIHILRKEQRMINDSGEMSFADQFYALAGEIRPV